MSICVTWPTYEAHGMRAATFFGYVLCSLSENHNRRSASIFAIERIACAMFFCTLSPDFCRNYIMLIVIAENEEALTIELAALFPQKASEEVGS